MSFNHIRQSILEQSEALKSLAERLPESCTELVENIAQLSGRVILCGMGKSGHISKKIAATMSSTGTPALYLHPSESLHGDMGMVTPSDMVIFLSKSGENPELNLMLPSLKKIGCSLVALTSNPESSLSRMVSLNIDLGEIKEICPLNLAPTTSTTLFMVLMDSIAMEVMRKKDISQEDYALFHPGGQLGRRLLYKVSDIMFSKNRTPLIQINSTAREMLHIITAGRMGAVLVCDKGEKLLGLVRDYDIRRWLETNDQLSDAKVSELMNSKPMTCAPTDNAYETLVHMRKREKPITLMPVLNPDHTIAGVLTLEQMVQSGLV